MTSNYFDVVFLGARLGSLLSAALLAKRGFRVLVLGQDHLPPSYEIDGCVLPRSPFTFLAAHSPVARRAFSELALHQLFRRRAVAMDPAYQIALPGHRFDLALEPALLDREIEREFPEIKRPIEDYHRLVARISGEFDRLVERDLVWPPESFFERREFARASAHQSFDRNGEGPDPFNELPEGHPFRLATRAPTMFGTGLDPEQLNLLANVRLSAAWLGGAARLEGGASWLEETLIAKIHTYSGEVRLRERAERILVRRNTVVGIRIAGTLEEIGCGSVVAASDLNTLRRLLADRAPLEELLERIGEPQARYYRYTLNVGMAAEGVPVGMARDVFFVRDEKRPLHGENLLHLEAHPTDAAGRRLLCVEALLPRSRLEEEPGFLETMRERLLASLADVVPFLGRHIVFVDSPHDGRDYQSIPDKRLVSPAEPWTRGPNTMPVLYSHPVRSALGLAALPLRTPIKRLLLCSDQVMPALGMEGTLLAAWSAARLVTKTMKKKDWMRRGLWTKAEL